MASSSDDVPFRIFLCYRREDTGHPAGRLYDRLTSRFGMSRVFEDVNSIKLGDDFLEVITAAIGDCDVLLVLIGDRWLTVTGQDGQSRLADPGDVVRLEIEVALAGDVRVIPILVDGARMPRADELPVTLAPLANRNALELSAVRFDADIQPLLMELDRVIAEAKGQNGQDARGAVLRQRLRDCLVQIDGVDAARPAGSGFFVAPGYILTCSHVAGRQAPDPVAGQWHGEPWSGNVVYASPPPSPSADGQGGAVTSWPEPDLAIIRLSGNDAQRLGHPCVRLASREPEEGSRMFALGMSGGPVLDLTSGEVCGIAKLAGSEQDGHAVPARLAYDLPADVAGDMMRAHDRYHDSNRDWVLAQRALWDARPAEAASLLPPESEAELLGLIAQLPGMDPAPLGQLYRESAGSVMHPDPGTLHETRDVALQLSDLLHDRDRPHPVIVLAELLAAQHPEFAADFRDWSTAEATRQHSRELLLTWRSSHRPAAARRAGTQADPMSAVIQLEPCAHARDRYVFTIWRYCETMVSVVQEHNPLTLREITARLKAELPALLGQLPGEHVIVEFILPPELFDEPVHLWQVFPRAFVRLGYRYPVVIRDWERINDMEHRNHAMIKWDWLRTQTTTPLRWLSCTDQRTVDDLYPWFEEREHSALGLPGPTATKAEAFAAALEAGVRVALWRLTRCAAHDGVGTAVNSGPCGGMLFQLAVDDEVAPASLHLLPTRIKELRLSPGPLSDAVLLWDNPHRGPYPRGLAIQ